MGCQASHCSFEAMPDYNGDDILCHCMSVKRNEFSPLIDGKSKHLELDNLIDRSGVGSVCMGCHPLIEEMMGEDIWTPVKLTSIVASSKNTKIFQFESIGDDFKPAKAGQHIILQAYIDGVWELRRYTLTTPSDVTTHREIIVKQEPNGKVSNWLHSLDGSDCLIRLSQPMGSVTPDIQNTKRLVCLVGGIGITPAISFIRSANRWLGSSRPIIIDHSVLDEESLLLQSKINQLKSENAELSINYRLTNKDGLINQQDISEIVAGYPECEFYVCGPADYSKAVLKYLEVAGVDKKHISIEHFSSPATKQVKQSSSYFSLGLILFFAFLAQDFFQLKMPWLEGLQATESYKIYSGLFLLLYIIGQFIMPYNKSCETAHASTIIYKNHKLRGAFAPLVFYVHSTQFGTAYLLVLSLVYFSNFLLGIFNHERISSPILRINYFRTWLPLHIILSVLTVAMIAFHVYVVASY